MFKNKTIFFSSHTRSRLLFHFILFYFIHFSYVNTDIFLICFDIARRETLDLVTTEYVPDVREYCPTALMLVSIIIIIIYYCY
jgi:hypothetical protein